MGGLVLTSDSDDATTGGGGSADASSTTSTTAAEAEPVDVELSDSELVKRFGDAIWRVEVDGCGVVGSGTAFAVDEHLLVTNRHVVAADTTPTLRNRRGEAIEGRVVGMSAAPDVAVVRVDTPLGSWLEWAPTEELSEGDHLLGLGYPVPDLDFTATPGSILSFKVSGATREAVRSDGAFDRGNSGGPALDTEGRVVGVITEMALSDGFQNVPLLFTHDALSAQVQAFSAATDTVEPDCTTVAPPPVPDWYEEYDWDDFYIDPIELPPIELPEYEPPAYEPPTTLACPTGAPTATVTEVEAVEYDPQYMPGYYDVTVRGVVTNPTSAPVNVYGIEVDVPGYGMTFGMTDGYGDIPPGGSMGWEAMAFVEPPGGPPSANVTGVNWMWGGWEYAHCG